MKTKIYLLILIFSSIAINVNAQFKISTGGNVAIASSPTPNDWTKVGISFSSTSSSSSNNYALYNVNTPTTTHINYYGIFSSSVYSSAQSYSRTIGIYGQAGNATNGYNYGVAGFLTGSQQGAGVYGATSGNGYMSTTGSWAGFFWGNVNINGNLYLNGTYYASDQRLKKNILTVSDATIDKLSQLNAVEYQYKSTSELQADGIIVIDDTTGVQATEDTNNIKIHYGYIAQDVQPIFPELVYEKENGILGLDYVGLIPLMLEALKQQEKKITQLQSDLADCCKPSGTSNLKSTNQNSTENSADAILYQNTPNPFSKETQIKCFIPDKSTVSNIFIYDMQGTQLKKLQINGKGNESLTIQSSELNAGMYMYTLIIDGKEIDTKKMILTN